jgi:predicted naringenin-chalcone synthase
MSQAACILGIGTAQPPHFVNQSDAARMSAGFICESAGQQRLLPALFRRSAVARRSSVILEGSSGNGLRQSFYPDFAGCGDRGPTTRLRQERYSREAAPLAREACRAALHRAGCPPESITHLVTVSCTGFEAPGVDIALIRELKLSPTTLRTHIGFMGCHGALNGLRTAAAIANSDEKARVLLGAVELCSLHFRYGWNPDTIVANSLFGDGAAAAVVASSAGSWRIHGGGANIFDDSADAMSWRIGDHGYEMTLSARVPALLEQHLRPWCVRMLHENGLALSDVRSWAIHPGGPRIVGAVAEALGLSAAATAASNGVLADCGNMSSPTVMFIMQRLMSENAKLPCVAIGFGPGLAAEALIFAN